MCLLIELFLALSKTRFNYLRQIQTILLKFHLILFSRNWSKKILVYLYFLDNSWNYCTGMNCYEFERGFWTISKVQAGSNFGTQIKSFNKRYTV